MSYSRSGKALCVVLTLMCCLPMLRGPSARAQQCMRGSTYGGGMSSFGGGCGGYPLPQRGCAPAPYCFPVPTMVPFYMQPQPVFFDTSQTYVYESAPLVQSDPMDLSRLDTLHNSLPQTEALPQSGSSDLSSVISDVFGKKETPPPPIGTEDESNINRLTDELKAKPNAADLWLARGLANARAHRYAEAVQDLQQCCKLDPSNDKGFYNLGLAHARCNQYPKALECLDKAIAISPRSAQYPYQRGLVCCKSQDFKAALVSLSSALLLQPGNQGCYYARSFANLKLNRTDEAIADARKASTLDPGNARSFYMLGMALAAARKHNEALEAFDKALKLQPKWSQCLAARASSLVALGRLAEAVKDCSRAIKDPKVDSQVFAMRAACYSGLAQFYTAAEDLTTWLQHNPQDADGLMNRATVYYEVGNYDRALNDLTSLIQIRPNNVAAIYRRCFTNYMLGRGANAVADAMSGLKTEGWSTAISTYFAICAYAGLVQTGQRTSAKDFLKEALEKCDHNKWPYPILEFFTGNLTAAQLLAAAPGTKEKTEANAYIGLLLAWSGKKEDARAYLEAVRTAGQAGIPEYLLAVQQLYAGQVRDRAAVEKPIANKWALVIGISKFKDSAINLRYSDKDAADFAAFLSERAGFPAKNVRLMQNEEATREKILDALGDGWLPRVSNPDDLVVVYLSTHGSPSNMDATGANYIVAHDTDRTNLLATGIVLQDLSRMIKDRVHANRVVVVIDACHSGAAQVTKSDDDDLNFPRMDRNIDAVNLARASNQLVICSSLPEELSWESKNYANGVFTHHLIDALAADGGHAKISAAFQNMKKNVEQEVLQDRTERQTPVLKSTWPKDDLQL